MLTRTNKKSKTVEERIPRLVKYHHHLLELRASARADRPDQPRDKLGGRFAYSDTYSFDEHPVELVRNHEKTYEYKGTEFVHVIEPRGSLDQRQCLCP